MDAHVHFRQEPMCGIVAPVTAAQFRRALVMPNTYPDAIRTPNDIIDYNKKIIRDIGSAVQFEPLMTFKIYPDTDPNSVPALQQAGAIAGKVYPKGLTTHAEDGIADFFALYRIFEAMQEENLVLCFHGEMPGDHLEWCDRETAFLQTLTLIARTFPRLRIVMEHITTEAAVHAVLSFPENVAATITVHHLLLTHDDVGGDRMRPHHFCKPVAKKRSDRAALLQAAISGCPKFFLGTDSAPHDKEKKECAECCAGVFTAPVTVPLLVQIFDKHNALDRLPMFTSQSAKRFYDLKVPTGELTIIAQEWRVPSIISNVVPFYANQTLQWQVN